MVFDINYLLKYSNIYIYMNRVMEFHSVLGAIL